jgi:hypothetical protein
MAFAKSDGTAGSLRDDGKIDQNYKGAISAGGSSVKGDLFDVKAITPPGDQASPVPQNINNAASHAGGSFNVLDGGTIANVGGADRNSKIGDVSPGANASNNVSPMANVIRATNYKGLTSAGNWNIVQGKFEAGDPFKTENAGAWSVSSDENQAEDMRKQGTDTAAYNPNAPFIVSQGTIPVAFVAEAAPFGREQRCECISPPRGTVAGPKYPDACDPRKVLFGGSAFCTGTNVRKIQVTAKQNCHTVGKRDAVVYLGYYHGFRDVVGSEGRCALIDGQYPRWDSRTVRWADRVAQGSRNLYFGASGDPGYVPDCQFHCGGWQYEVRAIDATGGFLTTHTKVRIYEREFHKVISLKKSCPEFTTGVYVAAASTLSPPSYTGFECKPALPAAGSPQPF